MAQYWDQMSKEEKKETLDQLKTQRIIGEVADIDYQCYIMKINKVKFWEVYLKE